MLKIEVKGGMTLAQIIEFAQAGKSVVQTPHVGNLPIDVLVALQAGLHVRLVDTNVGYLDKLFYPHLVVHEGKAAQVAESYVLVTHATVTKLPSWAMPSHFDLGQPVSTVHVGAARAAFPKGDIVPYADWIKPHQKLILLCLEVVTRLCPKIWERRVDARGVTENAQHSGIVPTWPLIMEEGICGITVPANAAGWVLPNPLSILVDILVDAAEWRRKEQYALSGPSMATYIQQNHRSFGPMDNLLKGWYAELVRQLPQLKLPERFTVYMVPAASWQLAVPMSAKDHLDALVDWYFDYKRRQVDVSQGIAMGMLQPSQVGGLRRNERRLVAQIAEPVRLWLSTQDTPAFATQYDVLATREPLYIHPIVQNTSVKSLAEVIAFIRAML